MGDPMFLSFFPSSSSFSQDEKQSNTQTPKHNTNNCAKINEKNYRNHYWLHFATNSAKMKQK